MWRFLLTLYFGTLTTFSPSICCCTFRFALKNFSCCKHVQPLSKTACHQHDPGHSCSHGKSCSYKSHSCCSTDKSVANASGQNTKPENHKCSCYKNKPTLAEASTATQVSQPEINRYANLFLFVLSETALAHLTVNRNLPQCNSIFPNSRELLRAHCILRC
jgi:hypothetical protein